MSQKQMLDESFAIDDEWRRIDKEKNSFKIVDAELDQEMDSNNAKVRELNSKGGGTPDETRQLKEKQAAFDRKEALLTERKRRLLYDIEEVNKKSRSFNDKFLKSGAEPKTIRTIQISVNGETLSPQPYKKGQPLDGGSNTQSPAGGVGNHSPSGKVKSRSFGAGKGGLVEESRSIDQEWARIEEEMTKINAEDKKLDDDMERYNARVREVNAMKGDQRAAGAELDEWQKCIDQNETAAVTNKRHLLYDIAQINERKRAFNDAIHGTDLNPKNIELFSYSQNEEKLTPLPY